MALTRVQVTPTVTQGSATTTIAVTFSTPPAVGNGVIVAIISGLTTGPTAVTDNRGHTYTLVLNQTNPNIPSTVSLWVCPVTTATGSPFTITATGASAARIACAIEVGGVGGGLSVDRSVGTAGVFPTAPTSGVTAALTGSEVFVVALIGTTSGVITVDATTPTWVQEAEEITSGIIKGEVDSRIKTSAAGTTQTATWTLSGANYWACALAAFKTPSTVAVPNVVGLTQSAATTAITGAGLTLGTVTPASSTTVAAGLVISQAPAAATVVALGSAVALTVSTGPPMVTVPNTAGMSQSAATAALTSAGFVVVVTAVPSPTVPAGTVLSQTPAAGASAPLGSTVTLSISRGNKAWTSARSGIARSGATRSNYVFPDVPGVVVIGGADYTAKILNGSLQVHLEINDKPDTCSFQVFVGDAATQAAIVVGADVLIGLTTPAGSNPIFGGQMVQVQTTRHPASIDSLASVMCADYLQIVDSQVLITYDWPAQSATTTILDLVARFANKPGGVTISTAGVQPGLPSHQAFGVINERFSTVLRRMVTMFPTPGGFYIDATKVLRVWTGKPEPGHTQPTAFTLANPHLKQFADLADGTPVRDAVIVEGVRTSAPIGTPPPGDYAARPGLVTFPVLDASIIGQVFDQPGREIRVGSQRLFIRYAQGPWAKVTPPGVPQPTSSIISTALVAFNPTGAGPVAFTVASDQFIQGRGIPCWVKVEEQYLLVTQNLGGVFQVPRTGFGCQTADLRANMVITAIDSFASGSLTGRYDAPGAPEVIRAQPIDADVVMVVRSSTPPGIHEQLVQDGRYVISGATNRGQHEIADFALPAKSIQFETTDTNALPGRVQSYSFVEPPLVTSAGDYMILTTDLTWPVWGELPLRTCTAANIGAADIVDAWLVDPR